MSNPGLRAVTAAREKPLEAAPRGPLKELVKSEASNVALNALSILKETWEDFRNSDRFFKYKAAIIAGWIAISLLTFLIARPNIRGLEVDNDLGARLVVAKSGERTVYMLENQSEAPWTKVEIVANGTYRAKQDQMLPRQPQTFTAKSFLDASGKPAPEGLQVRELVLRTSDGKTRLIEDGVPVQ